MSQISLKIVNPEETLFNSEVSSLVLPGSDGLFGVFPNHAPIISRLKSGTVSITLSNSAASQAKEGSVKDISIEGGFFYLDNNRAILIVNK